MTNYEFGYSMLGLCNVRQVRKMVIGSAVITGRLCDAEQGFFDAICHNEKKTGVDKAFIAKLEKQLSQKRIAESKG